MHVTIATDNRNPSVLPLSSDLDVGSLIAVLEVDTAIPAQHMRVLFNGRDIQDNPASTLGSLGVTDGSLLYVTRRPNRPANLPRQQLAQQQQPASTQQISPRNFVGMTFEDVPSDCDPRILREIIRVNPPMMRQLEHGNPQLAAAAASENPGDFLRVLGNQRQAQMDVKRRQQAELAALRRRIEQNPFDVEAQRRVEELIRAKNVESNHRLAQEHLPEAFTRVCMLYINCEVNGVPLKAFVDSGAQNTIMTQSCAERAGIMRLIDTRYAGQAVGVGTCKILGKVHMAPLKIGGQHFNCSFTVLENSGGGRGQSVEFLFGLDMLKRHQANINLKKNQLEIEGGSGTISVPFLSEAEIPNKDFNPGHSSSSDARSSAGGAAREHESTAASNSGSQSRPQSSIDREAADLARELVASLEGGATNAPHSGSSTADTADQKRQKLQAEGTAATGGQAPAAASAAPPVPARGPAPAPAPAPARAPAPAPAPAPAVAQGDREPSIEELAASLAADFEDGTFNGS